MRREMRSLNGLRTMPVPERPRVWRYGSAYADAPHDVRLFPAILRERGAAEADAVLEGGQSSCFFHPNLPATALCEVSGRMICGLCATEWEGRTVSFEALRTVLRDEVGAGAERGRVKWDDVALALVVFPMLFWLLTVVTAPLALGICLVQWRKGPTSVVRRGRWRYLVAGALALGQIALWVYFISMSMSVSMSAAGAG